MEPLFATVKKICDGLEIRMYDFFNCPAFNDLKKQEPGTNGEKRL